MSEIIILKKEDLNELLNQHTNKIISQLTQLISTIKEDKEFLTVNEFAAKARLSRNIILSMCTKGQLSFNQGCKGGKITIPATELFKLKQI